MGVDSRLALKFFRGGWVRMFWQFRVRFAFERCRESFLQLQLFGWMKGTNGKVTCDRGIAGEGEDDQ